VECVETAFGVFSSNPSGLRHLSLNIRKLWRSFNEKRDTLDRNYMSEKEALQAYFFSFFLPNVERSRGALTRYLKTEALEKVLSASKQDQELRILDFGSGPLSASIGLLCFLTEQGFNIPKNTTILAVEPSEDAVELGVDVLRKSGLTQVTVKHVRSLADHRDQTFHFCLAANVLNELPSATQSKTATTLYDLLTHSGVLLLLEPGQEDHARRLGQIRDLLLAKRPKLGLLGPCLHTKVCPLAQKDSRKDWCWFRHNFRMPAGLKLLDEKSGLDHRTLAYSFLLTQNLFAKEAEQNNPQTKGTRNSEGPKHKHISRIVSDPIPLEMDPDNPKHRGLFEHVQYLSETTHGSAPTFATLKRNKSCVKQLLCSSDGNLEALFAASRAELKSRGSELKRPEGALIGRERVNTKANFRHEKLANEKEGDNNKKETRLKPRLKKKLAERKYNKTK
jgi:hypothetical protein